MENINSILIIIPIILTIIYLILYWISGIIDPGLMKRNFDCYGASQLPIKTVHKGVYKITKICYTCNIVRPFRASHCNDCDNCILRLDHHCPWLGCCLGKRNYIFFYFYVLSLNLNNFFIFFFASFSIYDKFNSIKSKKSIILLHCIPSLITIIYLLAIMYFTTGLFFSHTRLVLKNITTKEEIRKLVHSKIGNPYDKGIINNCTDFFYRRKREPPQYLLKQLRKKTKVLKATPKILKPKKKRNPIPNLQEAQTFNQIDRNRFYSINEKNRNKIDYSNDNINNINNKENSRTRTYSMAVGNKRIYHAMKHLNLTNFEFNNLDVIEDKENESTENEDYDNALLNNNKDIKLTTS